MQDLPHCSQSLTRIKPETEIEHPKPNLPMWCRGIMGGCVNCGGCV